MILLLSGQDFSIERGAIMIQVLTHFLRIFNKSVLQENKFHVIQPLFVKFQQFRDKGDCDVRFQHIIDLYEQKVAFIKAGYQGDDREVLEDLTAP